MGLSSGTRLGPYQIVSLLGAGGMGEVYRARDSRLERDVAIKVLPPRLTDSPQARERFQREARAVAALQHPNICTIHDVGETGDGHAFLVMELLQGQTLQQRLGRGALDIASLVDLGAVLADALDAAHRAGIVHRDIKPANIFLTERGPKILDFGLAKAAPRPAADVSRDATTADAGMLTEEGTTVGTLAYMSPEQLRGEAVDAGTDLFSFGAVLYEMATATPAFPGATNAVISAAILHDTPQPPRALRADLPGPLNDIILKALEKDRQLRYQHASDLRADLRRFDRDTTASRAAGDGRSTAEPRPARRARWKVWAPAAAVILLAIAGAAGYVYAHRAPKLTDKDTIVLADFVNTTGDPVFDGTLRQGLSIQLQQSPFLSLVPDGRIRKTLGLMGRPADTRLTPEVAREVCERMGSTAVLEGSIASLGSHYVVGLRAKNCRTGDILDEQQAQAARKEDVLNLLSDAAKTFRTRVGESLTTVERHSKPLAEATTASLDALRAFSTGSELLNSSGNAAFVPFLKRAVEIDPDFALAHSQLGLAYSSLGESVLSRESTSRAYELRARTSDRERFFIAATYDRQVTGNLAKAADTFALWTQTYPRDSVAHGLWSGYATQGVGKYETSIDEARKDIDLDPDSVFGYMNLAYSLAYLDRFAECEQTLRQAVDRKFDAPELLVMQYFLAFLKNDASGMERAVADAKGKPGAEDWLTHLRALLLARSGQADQARNLSRDAADIAVRAGERERAALYRSAVSVWEGFFDDGAAAKRDAQEALQLARGRDVDYAAAFAFALAGDTSRSQELASELDRQFPEDTSVQFTYLPILRALAAVNAHEPAKALEFLKVAAPYDLAMPGVAFNGFFGGLYQAYVRGMAYMALKREPEAAAEFQKIVDHRGVVLADPIGALAHLQLGRTYAQSGETGKAAAEYHVFLTLWKDADADIPILRQAKAESARLPGETHN